MEEKIIKVVLSVGSTACLVAAALCKAGASVSAAKMFAMAALVLASVLLGFYIGELGDKKKK